MTTSAPIAEPCGMDTSDDYFSLVVLTLVMTTSAPIAGPCGIDTSDDSTSALWYGPSEELNYYCRGLEERQMIACNSKTSCIPNI